MENIITIEQVKGKRTFHLNQNALSKYMGWDNIEFVTIDSKTIYLKNVTMQANKANRRMHKLYYGDRYRFYTKGDGKLYMEIPS